MHLIAQLAAAREAEASYFRSYLLKEDIARLERLRDLALSAPSQEAFMKEAIFAGWSADDMRTHELKETLEPFLAKFFARARASTSDERTDAELLEAWQALDTQRMDRLVGCLSRVPRPSS